MPLPIIKLYLYLLIILVKASSSLALPTITIRSGGATTPTDIYKVWKPVYQAYRVKHTVLEFNYQGVGSGEGINRFTAGDYDFAGTDAELPESTYKTNPEFQMFPTMAGPVSIVYNIPELPPTCTDNATSTGCLRLTQETIVGIFNGTINRWNHPILLRTNPTLSTVDHTIILIIRGDSSGTTGIFTRALQAFNPKWNSEPAQQYTDGCDNSGNPKKWPKNLIDVRCGQQGRGASGLVLGTKYSVGYLGTTDARDSILAEAVVQNADGYWVVASVAGTQAAMKTMSGDLGIRLTGSLSNARGIDAYPITGYTYFLVHMKNMTNCTIATEILRYCTYVLTDTLAQAVVIDMFKAPLSPGVLLQVQQRVFEQMECRGVKVAQLVANAIAEEEGWYDLWKLPVTVVFALLATMLVMMSFFRGYVKYLENRTIYRNSFLVDLSENKQMDRTWSSGSIKAPSISSVDFSTPTDTLDWTTRLGPKETVLRQANGNMFFMRNMCEHFKLETMTWATRAMLVRMREKVVHANVMKFIGVAYHEEKWKLVSAAPEKGHLPDIIHAAKVNLDLVFRYSIITDITEGMAYLHRYYGVHGQLTSSSCYIDGRWNVVIGDWEQCSLHSAQNVPFVVFEEPYHASLLHQGSINRYCRLLSWTAPELLQFTVDKVISTIPGSPAKSADIYSYGLVVYEVFTDNIPYDEVSDDGIWAVLKRVKFDGLRPAFPPDITPLMADLIASTWHRNAAQRPTFSQCIRLLHNNNPKRRSIIDSMIQAVEEYASSLEERTVEMEKLTKSMETLLHNMLPSSIADKLARGEQVDPEFYEESTLFFSDIVGFTSIAAMSSPIDIVKLLNGLYSAFDGVIDRYDVYKVETIGDSYMCISGLPQRNENRHFNEMASMALDILFTVTTLSVEHLPDTKLRVRIGLHSGAVMAGVVGIKMPRYCLFGDTVNTASRMESSSLPMRIQISSTTKLGLDKFPGYKTYSRGVRNIKGKGEMTTYWLYGKDNYPNELPKFNPDDDKTLTRLLDKSQIK